MGSRRERSSAPPTPMSQPVLFLPWSRGYRCLPEGIPAGILHRSSSPPASPANSRRAQLRQGFVLILRAYFLPRKPSYSRKTGRFLLSLSLSLFVIRSHGNFSLPRWRSRTSVLEFREILLRFAHASSRRNLRQRNNRRGLLFLLLLLLLQFFACCDGDGQKERAKETVGGKKKTKRNRKK